MTSLQSKTTASPLGNDAQLAPDVAADLSRLAERLNRPPRELLNEAVREYLARHDDPTLGTDKAVPPPKGG